VCAALFRYEEKTALYFGGWDYTLHAFSVPGAAVSTATRGLHVA